MEIVLLGLIHWTKWSILFIVDINVFEKLYIPYAQNLKEGN
ncbi:MAG TPA: hypothetical protein PK930_25800 [Leptospiraceae bacterium]|nr:hypothetical protein [Leptospiraceae bacterium]